MNRPKSCWRCRYCVCCRRNNVGDCNCRQRCKPMSPRCAATTMSTTDVSDHHVPGSKLRGSMTWLEHPFGHQVLPSRLDRNRRQADQPTYLPISDRSITQDSPGHCLAGRQIKPIRAAPRIPATYRPLDSSRKGTVNYRNPGRPVSLRRRQARSSASFAVGDYASTRNRFVGLTLANSFVGIVWSHS